MRSGFNTQPPEGGWIQPHIARHAARRFNTQPPEGGWASNRKVSDDCLWFQHTAARRRLVDVNLRSLIGEHSFNTQPPEGGWGLPCVFLSPACMFQHTAARRRLVLNLARSVSAGIVSTHSRPKAAGCAQFLQFGSYYGFNTQPPEGGWQWHSAH